MKLYLCWQNNQTVLGVATSENKAREMCAEIGDSYMEIESDVTTREHVESTFICKHRVKCGRFLTYDECIKAGYKFKKVEKYNEG